MQDIKMLSSFGKTIFSEKDTILDVSYYINEHGYRSESFKKNNEVLVLGCSQTYGSGLPNEFTWPEIFSNDTNKKYSRIAKPGDSINSQVYKAFKYFEEIGNPEIVIALFPMYRLEYTVLPNKFLSPGNFGTLEILKSVPESISMAYFNDKDILKFSKIPHDPSYVIPVEFCLFYNFMFIKMLEQYCDSHNIKFIWHIYDMDKEIYNYIKTNSKNTFKNYLDTVDFKSDFGYGFREGNETDADIQRKLLHEKCFEELKDHELYNNAADYDKRTGLSHWGIHIHKHIAEKFIAKYREVEND